MTEPLVTVIIPCYNAADTIVRAIDSVRRQTWRPLEIIAVDDASTDNTRQILEAEAERGDVTVVALDRNLRAAGARNAGFAQSHGEFIAFLDSDDEWLPEKVARQVALLASHPDMTFVSCDASNVTLDGTVRERIFSTLPPALGRDGWRTMLAYSNAMPSVAMVRRSAFDAVGGFHLGMELIEDQDFFIRVALLGETGFVDEVLVITHTQPAGLSHRTWRWDIEVWPAVRRHIEAQKDRLSFGERRHIYGFRYARLGRNVYAEAPLHGAMLILRGMLNGNAPLANAWYLIVASPPVRTLKGWLARGRQDRTIAR